MAEPPQRCDLVVVGGGIIGLAVARELLRRRPDATVTVLEREAGIAQHQTGHNSGVVHQGVYYQPGSLKAELCRRGATALYRFCEERGIRAERCGKVIVATSDGERRRLDELHRRGLENGVPGIRLLSAAELREIEPHVRGIAALHSPETGIVDFPAVAAALADDVRAAGGQIVTGCAVERLVEDAGAVRVEHALGQTQAGLVIACAGLWSDRLAVRSGLDPDPRIVPFRGAYHRLRPDRRGLVRGLVYPVPDPRLPFLGIHLTRHVDGEVLVGPSALLVGARDAYRLRTVRGRDLTQTLLWPGTWRVVGRFWRSGVEELSAAASARAFAAAARRYVPALERSDLLPGPAGVRAQAVSRGGSLVDDFVFSQTLHTLHVRNAPSPGATSSLAIAEHVVERALSSHAEP